MKASPLVCLLALAAMVSTAPQSPIPISNNSKSKSIEDIKSIAPTVPVPEVTPAESKPKEWLSSTPTVADRSRCLNDYRSKNPDAPPRGTVGMASPHQYPFVVTIGSINEDSTNYDLSCIGSLISPTKILTAASWCLSNPSYFFVNSVENKQVRLGMHFLNKTTSDAQVTRNVTDIIVQDFKSHSIGILTMDSPVEYTDTISPVCLVPDCFDDDSGQSVIAMGWDSPNDQLGFMRFSTLPFTTCHAKGLNVGQNLEFCGHKECGDFCPNYNGGPVVIENNSPGDTSCRFMQVGVFPYFRDKNNVGSFIRVKKHLTWIEENMK